MEGGRSKNEVPKRRIGFQVPIEKNEGRNVASTIRVIDTKPQPVLSATIEENVPFGEATAVCKVSTNRNCLN